ncbi:MAG TPA: PQQ-binding-like beta-propeller repeat protein, partial [Candidatus Acidoferrales bacterium]|nr:PQQ-binding-like beta-propeller repeat protein [Candidatus Acidoferrales bacterium]
AGARVIAATENDTVYAFDLQSGRQLWSAHLGEPVQAATLPCGNIRPVTGITGTPVADPAAGLLYVMAFLSGWRHQLFALRLRDGSVAWQAAADPPGADPKVHQQRPALALANGYVYVAYGGLLGDCGDYHGWVLGVSTSNPGSAPLAYRVPSGRRAGIWAPPGPAVDAAGNLYVATGNSNSTTTFDYGNAVIKLSPDLRQLDYFAIAEWAQANRTDADLGTTQPSLLDGGLVFVAGKTGQGYLLRGDHLGGVGGQAFAARVCGAAYGGTAYSAPMVYVPCTDGVTALRVEGGRFSTAWHRGPPSGSPILAAGAVWALEPGAGVLYVLDPASGKDLARALSVGAASRFMTPAATAGYVIVGAGRRLVTVAVA